MYIATDLTRIMALAQKYNYTYERGKFNVYTQQVNFIQAHTRGEQVLVKNYSSLANNTNKEARPSLVSYNTLTHFEKDSARPQVALY